MISNAMISTVFAVRLRVCAAVLCLCGTGLAGMSAALAFPRLGVGQGVAFTAVAVATAVLAVAVLAATRWALWVVLLGIAGQPIAVLGTVGELLAGVDAGKAAQLRRLGFDPTVGVAVNLVYSSLASAVFVWWLVRWLRLRRHAAGMRNTGQGSSGSVAA
jgi:hypothetical protein